MKSFLEYIQAGSFLNTAQVGLGAPTWGVDHSLTLSSPTLDIPTQIISGKIRKIHYTENPIMIELEIAPNKLRRWPMTKKQWEYAKSIGKEPRENMRVQMELFLDGTIKGLSVIGNEPGPVPTVVPTPWAAPKASNHPRNSAF